MLARLLMICNRQDGCRRIVIQADLEEKVTLQYVIRLKVPFRWIGGEPGAWISRVAGDR